MHLEMTCIGPKRNPPYADFITSWRDLGDISKVVIAARRWWYKKNHPEAAKTLEPFDTWTLKFNDCDADGCITYNKDHPDSSLLKNHLHWCSSCSKTYTNEECDIEIPQEWEEWLEEINEAYIRYMTVLGNAISSMSGNSPAHVGRQFVTIFDPEKLSLNNNIVLDVFHKSDSGITHFVKGRKNPVIRDMIMGRTNTHLVHESGEKCGYHSVGPPGFDPTGTLTPIQAWCSIKWDDEWRKK